MIISINGGFLLFIFFLHGKLLLQNLSILLSLRLQLISQMFICKAVSLIYNVCIKEMTLYVVITCVKSF